MESLLDQEDSDLVSAEPIHHGEEVKSHPLSLPEDVQALATIKQIAIASEATRTLAAETLVRASTRRKQIEDQEEVALADVKARMRAMKAEQDAIKEPYEFQIGALVEVEQYCKSALRQYDAKKLREAEAEQARLNAETANKNQRIEEKAEAKNLAPRLVAPPMAQAPVRTVRSELGSVSRKRLLVWSINGILPEEATKKSIQTYDIPASDPRLADVPREYLVLNVPKLNKERSMGRTIPGLLCTEELDYGTRRGDTK